MITMYDFYNAKTDLSTLSNDEIETLFKFYSINNISNREDRLWLIAINILSTFHRTEMPPVNFEEAKEFVERFGTQSQLPSIQSELKKINLRS